MPYKTFAKSHGLPVQPLFDIPDTGTQLPYDGDAAGDAAIYDLSGRRVNAAALPAGVYIKVKSNGNNITTEKFIVK